MARLDVGILGPDFRDVLKHDLRTPPLLAGG